MPARDRGCPYLLWRRDKCPFHGVVKCAKCRCPDCGRGYVLESSTIDWCSLRYWRKVMCRGPTYPATTPPAPAPPAK